ncbi:MAG: diaminopimelate epimerase [Parachlamydiaceae bacterium]
MRSTPSKYAGCGNSFLLIDQRDCSALPALSWIVEACQQEGVDGVIFLEKSAKADYKMRIFNSDASEAEMCGNGLRCLGRFIEEKGEKRKRFTVESLFGVHAIELLDDQVKVQLGTPKQVEKELSLNLKEGKETISSLDTGVPHAVLFVADLEAVDVADLGEQVRHHPRFFPRGTNANFVIKTGDQSISLRTFERGVEAETLACGTGAAASAIAASWKWGLKSPIVVETRSGEKLTVEFQTDPHGKISNLTQQGPVKKLSLRTQKVKN